MKKIYRLLTFALSALLALPAMAFTPATTISWQGTDPENGNEVESLEVIYVYFTAEGEDDIYYVDASWSAEEFKESLTLSDGTNTYSFKSVTQNTYAADSHPYFKFTLSEAITTGGTYTLTIPENSVYIYDADYNNEEKVSPAFTASWTIPDAGEVVDADVELLTLNPAILSTVYMYVTDPNGEKTFRLLKSDATATVTDEADTQVTTAYIFDYGNMFALNLDKTITTAGTYTIKVPKGVFGGDGFINDVCTGTVTIDGCVKPKVTVIPDNSAPLSELSGTISIAYDDYEGIYFANGEAVGSTITITGPDNFFAMYTASLSANVVSINVEEAITAEGIYHLTVPAGEFVYYGDNEDVYFDALDIQFTVGEGRYYDVTIDPAQGVVTSFKEFNITFGGADQIAVNGEAGPNDFPYYGTVADDGTITKVSSMMMSVGSSTPDPGEYALFSAAGPVLNVNAYGEVSDPGNYAIVIPVAAIKVDGDFLENELVFKYTIEASGEAIEYTVESTPADGATVSDLSTIEITFSTEAEGVTFAYNSLVSPELARYDDEGNKLQVYNGTYTCVDNVITWNVYSGRVVDEGNYVFNVGDGWMSMTGADGYVTKSSAFSLSFYVDGTAAVELVTADGNATYDVYNLQGIQVLRNAEENALNNLPAGLYIVNGEKRLIKR